MSTPRIFHSLNCRLCGTPYGTTSTSPNAPRQTGCTDIQAVCSVCFKEKMAMSHEERRNEWEQHQCDGDGRNCFGWLWNPSYYILNFLSQTGLELDYERKGYLLKSPISIPECPICHEEYSLDHPDREPFGLWCGHVLCDGCFTRIKEDLPEETGWKYSLCCPECQRAYRYNQLTWENPLKAFLREYPEMLERMKVGKIGGEEEEANCEECKEKQSLTKMFKCRDCNQILCGECGLRKHRQHQIDDLQLEQIKKISTETQSHLHSQLTVYTICFPVLQEDLLKTISAFQKGIIEEGEKIEKSSLVDAKRQQEICIKNGQSFEEICERYLGELRLCETEIGKLLSDLKKNGFTSL